MDSDIFCALFAAAFCHSKDINLLYYALGFLNSKCCQAAVKVLNPTINIQISDIGNVPVIIDDTVYSSVLLLVTRNISLSRNDWNSFEISWDFVRHPLI